MSRYSSHGARWKTAERYMYPHRRNRLEHGPESGIAHEPSWLGADTQLNVSENEQTVGVAKYQLWQHAL